MRFVRFEWMDGWSCSVGVFGPRRVWCARACAYVCDACVSWHTTQCCVCVCVFFRQCMRHRIHPGPGDDLWSERTFYVPAPWPVICFQLWAARPSESCLLWDARADFHHTHFTDTEPTHADTPHRPVNAFALPDILELHHHHRMCAERVSNDATHSIYTRCTIWWKTTLSLATVWNMVVEFWPKIIRIE